jgi:type II secretory ATPase GspE/PulE/Tfp pilus assembly ATPase PilB-like protein
MLLAVGPTGSGKTTTLYGLVNEIRQEPMNIVTIEDPIEYEVDGVSQVPVNEKTGLTFSKALRSILRQDPDVILVGEIRDSDTAVTALHAAMTGHLVMSTLHATDAVTALLRLAELGVDRTVLASAMIGVVG